jgi:hypothetical protein
VSLITSGHTGEKLSSGFDFCREIARYGMIAVVLNGWLIFALVLVAALIATLFAMLRGR